MAKSDAELYDENSSIIYADIQKANKRRRAARSPAFLDRGQIAVFDVIATMDLSGLGDVQKNILREHLTTRTTLRCSNIKYMDDHITATARIGIEKSKMIPEALEVLEQIGLPENNENSEETDYLVQDDKEQAIDFNHKNEDRQDLP